jgi:hypothetical protein
VGSYLASRVEIGIGVRPNFAAFGRVSDLKFDDFFIGIRQRGVVMGLEFNHEKGAMHVMKALYDNGVWAIFSTLDPRVLQFKPGILYDKFLCDEVLNRLETAVGQARAAAFGGARRAA